MSEFLDRNWQTLACVACGGQTFLALHGMQVKVGGGMTMTQQGYECAACHAPAKVADMQHKAYIAARKAELAALEAELGEEEPPRRTMPTSAPPPLMRG